MRISEETGSDVTLNQPLRELVISNYVNASTHITIQAVLSTQAIDDDQRYRMGIVPSERQKRHELRRFGQFLFLTESDLRSGAKPPDKYNGN